MGADEPLVCRRFWRGTFRTWMKGIGPWGYSSRLRVFSAGWLVVVSTFGWAGARAQPPWTWRADARFAPPGLAHVVTEFHRRTAASSASAGLRWTTGGGADLGMTVALHSEIWSTGIGCSVAGTGAVDVRFGMGSQKGAFEVVVPVVQPAVLPFRPTWKVMYPVDFGREARGVAFLSWSPGSVPSVFFRGWRGEWSVGAGSSGCVFARAFPFGGGLAVRVQLGWMRTGIPWLGVITREPRLDRPIGFSESPLWDRQP